MTNRLIQTLSRMSVLNKKKKKELCLVKFLGSHLCDLLLQAIRLNSQTSGVLYQVKLSVTEKGKI